MRWRWAWGLLPLGLGLLVKAALSSGYLANPILYLRSDLGTLATLGGALLAVCLSPWLWQQGRWQQRLREGIVVAQQQALDEHQRFVRRLDHELKNPLTAIRAGLANLADPLAEEERRATLASVEAQVVRLSQLAADLRKLAELETQPLERTEVDLAALLQEALEVAREQPDAAGRSLTLTLPQAPWPLPHIQADADLLLLAVHNLLSNACKFTRPGDRIEMRGREDGASVVIEVADTGAGIPPGEQPLVWQELYRGQGARGIPGSGLGLAMVRTIVERHGGQAEVRSRVGQGSVFALRLPAR